MNETDILIPNRSATQNSFGNPSQRGVMHKIKALVAVAKDGRVWPSSRQKQNIKAFAIC
jgi:hypothetical protein